jgi:hypothetical protein
MSYTKGGKLKGKLGSFAKEREEFEQKRKELEHEMELEKHNMGMIRKGKHHEMKFDESSEDHDVHEMPDHQPNLKGRRASSSMTSRASTKSNISDPTPSPDVPSKGSVIPLGSKLSDWCYTGDLDSLPPTFKNQTLYENVRFLGRGAFGSVELIKNVDDSKL